MVLLFIISSLFHVRAGPPAVVAPFLKFTLSTSHNTRFIASSLSLLGPRQNALIRAFCSDTLDSSLTRFVQRRKPETLCDIPSADIWDFGVRASGRRTQSLFFIIIGWLILCYFFGFCLFLYIWCNSFRKCISLIH